MLIRLIAYNKLIFYFWFVYILIMRKINQPLLIGALVLCCNLPIFSQIQAITSSGDEVLLYDDGTWVYADQTDVEPVEILENPNKFIKPSKSNFLAKSKKLNIGVWFDTKSWSFSKGEESEAAEYKFTNKTIDLYGMLISERVTIPIENLRNIAIKNARAVASDLVTFNEEYRYINGIRVLSIQGIRCVYHGYYYSNENGTIQLLMYSSDNLMKSHAQVIEDFLNGFVEL
jgi:hypothetical protein